MLQDDYYNNYPPIEEIPHDAPTNSISEYLNDEQQAAMDEMQAEYSATRAEEQAIIKAQLEKIHQRELRQIFERFLISAYDNLPPMVPVLKRDDVLLCSEGNISAVVGEAKSKKTFFCTALVGSMLDIRATKNFGIEMNRCMVLWIDTEQSPEHIQKVLFRINLLGGLPHNTPNPNIHLLVLREESPADRLTAMCAAMEYYHPKLVVVDGVSDLMSDTNCLKESEELVSRLLALSSEHKCHIMCVLHTNPSSDKARGHLGSTLMRKAESVIFVHKTGDRSIVEPQYCRNMPFKRFAFSVEEMPDAEHISPLVVGLGIPVECELPADEGKGEDECVRILREAFGGVAEKRLLNSKLCEELGITNSYARVKLHRAISKGMLYEEGTLVKVS